MYYMCYSTSTVERERESAILQVLAVLVRYRDILHVLYIRYLIYTIHVLVLLDA